MPRGKSAWGGGLTDSSRGTGRPRPFLAEGENAGIAKDRQRTVEVASTKKKSSRKSGSSGKGGVRGEGVARLQEY